MSSQIQITGETKVKSLTGVLVGTSGVVSSLNIDGSLGIPQLDVNGKILVSQLPNSVMEYKGTWDASTNTPTLVNGTGNQGDVYLCSVAGTVNFGAGAIAFVVSDQVIYSGSIWQKASGTNGTVTSVGLSTNAGAITIGSSPITTSGTITANFNGTNLQYVNGAGNLTTFPILTGYVTAVSGTAPVVSSGGTTPAISMAAATGSVDGYLSATDFAIFNAKQSALTFSSPLVNTSGTISIPAATTSVNGYLASADFTTFNAKQNAITLTTTGTSGASTLVGATLNIPNYGSALTGYVPYTGATQDVDLDTFKLNAQSIHAKGTGGNGHLGLKHQSASATASANEVSLFADSLGNLSWLNGNLYLSKFIISGNTAARSYTFPNANGTVALTSDISYPVTSVFGRTGAVVATSGDYTTTLVTEGTNLYYTQARFDTAFAAKSTTNLTEGTNLYFTNARAIASTLTGYVSGAGTISATDTILSAIQKLNGNIGALTTGVSSVFGRTGAVVATSGDYTTTQVTEGTNLYFTDSRARLALSFVAGSGAYNSTTGVITIPTNNNQITNGAGYTTNVGTVTSVAATGGTGISITGSPITTSGTITITNTAPDQTVALTASTGISVTGTYPNFTITNTSPSSGGTVTSVAALTIGTSGTDLSSSVANSTTTPVITLNVPTASATNRGALSSADWTTFNNKQSALTNPVTGTGTTNYLPKFTGASTIGNSTIQDNTSSIVYTYSSNPVLNITDGTRSSFFGTATSAGAYVNASQVGDAFIRANNGIVFSGANGTGGELRLNSSGNLGLGVTPSAWGSNFKAFQVGAVSAVWDVSGVAGFSNNLYNDGTGRYITTNYATIFQHWQGGFAWLQAPSGTAGNAITFTQAMTLDASGQLAIGTPTANNKLTVFQSGASGIAIADISGGISGAGALQLSAGKVLGSTSFDLIQNSAGAFVYQRDNNPLTFGTNNVARLIIDSSGRTSIGYTTNPSTYQLDVNGTGRFSNTLTVEASSSGRYFNFINDSSASYLDVSHSLNVRVNGASSLVTALTIASTGAATFSSKVYANTTGLNSDFNAGAFIAYGASSTTKYTQIGYDSTSNYGWIQALEQGVAYKNLVLNGAGGNVGIGTTSPSSPLSIKGSANNTVVEFGNASTSNGYMLFFDRTASAYASGYVDALDFSVRTSATERMRITSGGNVQIDDSNSGSKLAVRGGNSTYPASSTSSYTLSLNDPTSSAINVGGSIIFQGFKTSTSAIGNFGGIVGKKENGTAGNESGFLGFLTSDSSGTFSEKMRITSGGALCLGVTSAYGTNLLNVNGGIYATSSIAAVVAADIDMLAFVNTGATYSKACVVASMTATGGTGSYFFYGQQSTSTAAIKIFSNGNIQNTNNSYGAISDARLKENIKDATPKLDDLMKVKVRNYNLKGESNKQLGVISQELEAIFPNMIEESTNMGENMKIKGVKYSVFVPMLIKAVQELKAEIEILKNK